LAKGTISEGVQIPEGNGQFFGGKGATYCKVLGHVYRELCKNELTE